MCYRSQCAHRCSRGGSGGSGGGCLHCRSKLEMKKSRNITHNCRSKSKERCNIGFVEDCPDTHVIWLFHAHSSDD